EANDLKEEAEKNFTQSYSTKSGLADWAAALKFNGDFRARYDTVFSDATAVSGGATNQFRARNRFRYRIRFGATVSMFDNVEMGLRLTSGDPASSSFSSGNPLSGNSTAQ